MGSQLPHSLESLVLALTHPRATFFRVTESLDLRLSVRLENLRKTGIFDGITHILDAGANEGAYGAACAKVFPFLEIICFEPVPSTYRVLVAKTRRYPKIRPVNVALGSSRKELPMNVGNFHVANSLLRMTAKHTENWPGSAPSDTVMVPVVPLDDFLEKEWIKGDFFLKADVQGYEIELLNGATKSLGRCKLLQLEVSLISLYEGAPSFAEVWNYVASKGFTLLDIVDVLHSPKDGAALSCDMIFIRA